MRSFCPSAIDWEASEATKPSMLLNKLAGTAVRMQAAPETAASELASYSARLVAVVALHTSGDAEKAGLPSKGLQAVLKAWLEEEAVARTLLV